MPYCNMRKDALVGIIEYLPSDTSMKNRSLHFSEWWNGEGLDFEFENSNKRISLDLHEMEALVTSIIACGMVDMEEVEKKVRILKREKSARAEFMEALRQDYNQGVHYD